MHSGKKRFYIWDMNNNKLLDSGLASHGSCDQTWSNTDTRRVPKFGNIPDSHCSSLGKYKIGKRGYSQWGIHVNYKLHGLERTNNKAYDRVIVLHSWGMINDEEVYPTGTAESWGCPAISDNFMRRMDERLSGTTKPVLFWMFYH